MTTMMTSPVPLHRFPTRVAGYFYDGVQRISRQYDGDASRIWRGRPRCAEVLARFREFRGVGPKIAHMAVNCLARELKVPLADYTAIDISADVHVLRVFGRLGLTAEGASREEVITRARQLNSVFPGLLDYPAWEIGRNWCRPERPQCSACYMQKGCATAKLKHY
jgi:endonuclease III